MPLEHLFPFQRCDGVRPICGSCRRKPKTDRCEWDNSQSKSRVAMLIDTIKSLEARIFELEHPELITPPVTLHYPYRRDEEESFQNCSPSLDSQPQCPNPSFPMPDFSSDNYWDTATPSTDTSSSSTPSVDGESFPGGPMELEYAPAASLSECASRCMGVSFFQVNASNEEDRLSISEGLRNLRHKLIICCACAIQISLNHFFVIHSLFIFLFIKHPSIEGGSMDNYFVLAWVSLFSY